ncbi:urease accessory protein UreF [Beggiatoa leptomitoformis]|uniref:Urease accessory protein UreF n=1 Tax=Beggiatoa leptomitoformis TaxID=288004 RepID=A0A2N9YEX1_9GAMM|nr:urease accessory protein UreF [Beggiatoa leptomitoformis]ALG68622.1 urease accessory protein UreF [Beggiatoa leptomitoformis]AUI69032.1 urease accessory protein UreF [Beggiatoa leptomitoformis]
MHLAPLLHLCHLVSPTLPIGMFAYSQGLESAIQQKWVVDEASAQAWIAGLLQHTLSHLDLAVLVRLYRAWQTTNQTQVEYWNSYLYASRESAELRAEDRHLGQTLARLLTTLELPQASIYYQKDTPVCYATVFSLAAVHWHIPLEETLMGYAWSWLENQTMAAVKLIPLGQSAGQRILLTTQAIIPHCVEHSLSLTDADIGFFAPMLAIGSALHETQYSRLFRS